MSRTSSCGGKITSAHPMLKELTMFFKQLFTDKAPGPDCFQTEILIASVKPLLVELHMFLIAIWTEDKVQQNLKDGDITTLFKTVVLPMTIIEVSPY